MTKPFAPARCAWAGLALAALAAAAPAQNAPGRARTYAVTGVRLDAGDDAPSHTLILSGGRIAAIQPADAPLPTGAWHVAGDGLLALPAFLDAWTEAGVGGEGPVVDQDRPVDTSAEVRIDMRVANRKGLQPAFRAADALTLEDKAIEAHHGAGFGLALAAPGDQLLAGKSAVVSLRPAAARDQVVRGEAFQHAGFRAGRGGYPGTLMAYHAQLRQFFLDARRHTELRERWDQGKPGPRPPWDADLEVGAALFAGDALVCEAGSARDVSRWLRLADELGLTVAAISGGRDAWKVADALAARDVAVVLELDWGEEADELPEEDDELAAYDYREPRGVREEKRRLWEQRRDNALRLHEAGVRVLFGTGEGKAKDLLANVRTLVEVGLPREVALAALTSDAAAFSGVERHYGALREGGSATLCLWSADPLTDEDAQVAWCFVDGFAHEYEVKEEQAEGSDEAPADGVDLTGTWTVRVDDDDSEPMTLVLTMGEDGTLDGTCTTKSPMDGSPLEAEVAGRVSGDAVSLEMTFSVGSFEVDVELEGAVDGDEWTGTSTLNLPGNEQENDFKATREPGGSR